MLNVKSQSAVGAALKVRKHRRVDRVTVYWVFDQELLEAGDPNKEGHYRYHDRDPRVPTTVASPPFR